MLFNVALVALLDVLLDVAMVALLDVLFGVSQIVLVDVVQFSLLEVVSDVALVALLDVPLDLALVALLDVLFGMAQVVLVYVLLVALLEWVVLYSWHLGNLCSIYELWVHVIDGFWATALPSVLYNGKSQLLTTHYENCRQPAEV